MFNATQIEALKAPLDRSHVRARQQAGRSLSYIEGWHAIAEANRIFGFDRWHRETVEMRQLGEPRQGKDKNGNEQWRVAYMAKVRIEVLPGDRCIIREGTGYGSGIDRDLGQAHESAIKEAETDAMKRALMTFGNPFGLALYDKEQNNVSDAAPTPKQEPEVRTRAAAPKAGSVDAEWARNAITEVNALKTGADLADWWQGNKAKVENMKGVDAALHRQLKDAVNEKERSLEMV